MTGTVIEGRPGVPGTTSGRDALIDLQAVE
jgi:hypothetical protein